MRYRELRIMGIQTLFRTFASGISWNALFLVFSKISTTILTFTLFYTLNATDFSLWASTNSFIYLFLLWLDCGLRKAIPRYALAFSQNLSAQKLFILGLACFQSILLLCALLIFFGAQESTSHLFSLPISPAIIPLAMLVFFFEGFVALLRLIFHAHFWIKQFNQRAMLIASAEVFADLFLASKHYLSGTELVQALFITKSIASLLLIIVSARLLKQLIINFSKNKNDGTPKLPRKTPVREFVVHALVMGTFTNLKSLSERNFLFPFFTHTLGIAQANLFKLANDCALLFHRTILKTIGTTDTALLSHAQLLQTTTKASLSKASCQKQILEKPIKASFNRLFQLVFWLCIPLISVAVLLVPFRNSLFPDTQVMHSFFIMTFGYLFEALLSPYERILEVKRKYGALVISYTPYAISILFVLFFSSCRTLTSTIAIFHATRLLGSLLTTYLAQKIILCDPKPSRSS